VETLEVKLAVIQGDYLYNQGNYEQALEEYKQATSVLVGLSDLSYLRKIERIPDLSVEQMYNAPKMMTEIPEKITVRSKGRLKATTVPSSTLNDEVPLDSLMGQIKQRQASTLLVYLQQMGNTKGSSLLEEAKRLLKEALEDHPCTELDKAVILYNLGAAYLSRTPIHPIWWSSSSFSSSLSKVSSSSQEGLEKGMRYLFEAYSLCAGATARPGLWQ
jgi:tetratricopeptide (TPR) repeat protein